jgi:hypothetical protein
LGRETSQKRLRNGWINGRVSAKVTASASPRDDQQSWGVALPWDQASRRWSLARALGCREFINLRNHDGNRTRVL